MGKRKVRTVFLQFFFMMGIWLVCVLVLLGVSILGIGKNSFLYPANTPEKMIGTVEKEIEKSQSFDEVTIPDMYQYTLYNEDNKVVASTMTKKKQANYQSLKKETDAQKVPQGQRQTKIVPTKYGTLVMSYLVIADFNNPTLRKWLPPGEIMLTLTNILLLLGGFFFISSRFGKTIGKELETLIATAEDVQKLQLDFPSRHSNIKEIESVLDAMNQMRDALKDSLTKQWQAEKQLESGIQAIAHDIKTPLTVIQGNVELLTETETTEEQASYLAYVHTHLNRIDYYMDELTHLSALEAKESSVKTNIKMEKLVETITSLAESIASDKQMRVRVQDDTIQQEVKVNEDELLRGLQNILANSVDYVPKGSELLLHCFESQEKLFIDIMDCGEGFSEEALEKGMDKFFTEDASRSQGKHYGMGLTIAQQMIQKNGGTIHLSNAEKDGKIVGAKVSISLPL